MGSGLSKILSSPRRPRRYYYRMAWAARGEEFIKDTPPERLKRMDDYVALSRPDLLDSLKLTAKPYLSTLYLLNVELLDGPRDARRKWLDLGTSIDPNNSLLRKRYMVSLQPRWGAHSTKCARLSPNAHRRR